MKNQIRNEAILDSRHPVSASFGQMLTLVDNLDKPIVMSEARRINYLRTPVKYVSAMSLLICMGGTMRVAVGSREYTMRRADLMLLGSGIICDIRDVEADARFCTLVFKEEFCRAFTEHLAISFFQKVFFSRPICHVPEQVAETYTAVYHIIKAEVEGRTVVENGSVGGGRTVVEGRDEVASKAGATSSAEAANGKVVDSKAGLGSASQSPLRMEVVRNYLQGLLFSVCDHYLSRANEAEAADRKLGRKEDLYNRFVDLVRRDFTRERGIIYYADRLCVTPRYLSQVVYQQSGYLAGEYINRLVITEAQQLVQSGQYTIGQVSQMLNFTSVSFFSRYFKKLTGYSPKEYQKM